MTARWCCGGTATIECDAEYRADDSDLLTGARCAGDGLDEISPELL